MGEKGRPNSVLTNMALVKDSSGSVAQRFKERILHTYFVRCDMSLILLVVVASGVGSSKLLLESGVHSLLIRYPLALLVSFLAFLLLIRVWIWYVFCRKPAGPSESRPRWFSGSGRRIGLVPVRRRRFGRRRRVRLVGGRRQRADCLDRGQRFRI